VDELHDALRGVGINLPRDTVEELLRRMDADASGDLDIGEFVRLILGDAGARVPSSACSRLTRNLAAAAQPQAQPASRPQSAASRPAEPVRRIERSQSDEDLLALEEERRVTREFQQRRRAIEEDALLYNNPHFSVEPPAGELWPNGFVDLLGEKAAGGGGRALVLRTTELRCCAAVNFRPTSATVYTDVAYCAVSGVAERLPIKLQGSGIGPKAVFSYDLLDIGEVFPGAVHRYQVRPPAPALSYAGQQAVLTLDGTVCG
jgi:hypothetical protein